jgi:long-chain acyl-CoA synthetase
MRHPNARRPFAWEQSYPPGVAWDAPIATTTLPRALEETVARYGDRPALEYRDRRTSYRDLGRAVERTAAGLLAAGLGREDAVALYLPNTPAHPISLFGVLYAGGRVVHLSPLDAERELAFKLADSGARTLVTTNLEPLLGRACKLLAAGRIDRLIVAEDQDFAPSPAALPMPEAEARIATLAGAQAHASGRARWPVIEEDDIALLQYTGGTTGEPKAAMLSHANLSAAIAMGNAWARPQGLAVPGEGRIICVLPLFHIYSLTSVMLRGLSNGAELLLRPRFDVATTLADIEQKRATAFPAVPTMWTALAAHPGIEHCDFSSLESVASGGAPLPVEIEERVEAILGRRMLGGWGMTETSPAGTQVHPGRPDKRGTIGLPLPGVEMEIVALDDPRRLLGANETGEIRIRGRNVTRGYWRRPEETANAFVDGWLLTGDIGRMDSEGFFTLVDRKKDMIISGGFNVYPRMIEEAIYEHEGVEEALVIGVRDAYRGEAAKAFVKLKAGAAALTLEELRAFLADKIGRHALPAALEVRDALPRTSVGKLSKKELIEEERGKGNR